MLAGEECKSPRRDSCRQGAVVMVDARVNKAVAPVCRAKASQLACRNKPLCRKQRINPIFHDSRRERAHNWS
jgi:hypothetical protein